MAPTGRRKDPQNQKTTALEPRSLLFLAGSITCMRDQTITMITTNKQPELIASRSGPSSVCLAATGTSVRADDESSAGERHFCANVWANLEVHNDDTLAHRF